MVSTDDPEIAEIARASGAEVPFVRPVELADDTTGTGAVIRHGINALEGTPEGTELAALCLVYPAAVFVRPNDLRDAFDQLQAENVEYVFSATTFPSPIQRAIAREENGQAKMFWPEHLLTRSQDLPEAWHDVGQFYWGRRDAWVGAVPVLTGQSLIHEIPRWRVQDIDTPEDWVRAELLFEMLQRSDL